MPYDRPGKLPAVAFDLRSGSISPRSPEGGDGPRLDFEQHVPFWLTAVSNKIARSASRVYLQRFGVGINEWRILANLRVRPGITANLICQTSGLDKAAVSRSLRLLDGHGHVVGGDAPDVRGRSLRLTRKGEELHDALIGEALRQEEELLTGFSGAERGLLLAFIARMHANATALHGMQAKGVDGG